MKIIISFLLMLTGIQVSLAQNGNKPLDLKEIVNRSFLPRDISEIQSLPDGEHYTLLSNDKKSILRYSYKTGQLVDTLFNVSAVRETRLESIEGYIINSTGYRIIVWTDKEYVYRRSWKANLFDYDVRRNYLKPLSDREGKLMNPVFSPDGRMCAFIRDNNIWLKKFDYDTESPVTKDGELGKIINGLTDWVYEEEFVVTNLLSWSPDSKFLSFVKFDESEVPSFSFQVFDGSLYPGYKEIKYPKAGQKNSNVSCHTYNVETKDIKLMNIPLEKDGYIPLIKYTNYSNQLAVMTLNRNQNLFNMYFINPGSGVSRLILRDESKYYIDSDLLKYITFTNDNFVYIGEKDGYAHIYLYSATGVLQKQVTNGSWDVTDFYGIDPASNSIYYQSSEESPLNRSVYKIDQKGIKTKLSSKTGINKASFSSNFNYYINWYSDVTTPTQISINDAKGKEIVLLEDNSQLKSRLAGISLPKKEFFSFTNADGISLNGWIIKPVDFSAEKKYPVVLSQYSGPNSQQVLNKFDISWEYYLAGQGYIVVCVDGRGTGARGVEFRKCTYLNLYKLETQDQISVAEYISSQSYADKNRIAIWGWSYGGSMTLMAMSLGNGIFKAGVAIAPVTDWKLYDTIYTERYMRTPNENFSGYEFAPINLVDKLQGKLLLIHGTSDDNVHFQNSLYYSEALVEAGKQFEMQIYSNKNHSLLGEKTRFHLYTRIIDFLNLNL